MMNNKKIAWNILYLPGSMRHKTQESLQNNVPDETVMKVSKILKAFVCVTLINLTQKAVMVYNYRDADVKWTNI